MRRQDDDATGIARTLRDLHQLLHGPRAWALGDADRRLLQDLVVDLEEVLAHGNLVRGTARIRAVAGPVTQAAARLAEPSVAGSATVATDEPR